MHSRRVIGARPTAASLVLPLLLAGCAATAVPVQAGTESASTGEQAPGQSSGFPTSSGPQVEVSPSATVTGSKTLTVTGTGFDETKGIYVAYCLAPEPGQPPTPCAGGADTSGELAASVWVSSDPPPYGEELAIPFGSGGTFQVQIAVAPQIDDIDCRVQTCGIATRADHTRGSDRSQDVFVPITFEGASE